MNAIYILCEMYCKHPIDIAFYIRNSTNKRMLRSAQCISAD